MWKLQQREPWRVMAAARGDWLYWAGFGVHFEARVKDWQADCMCRWK